VAAGQLLLQVVQQRTLRLAQLLPQWALGPPALAAVRCVVAVDSGRCWVLQSPQHLQSGWWL
jgi:hypothetical protein